MQPKRPFFIAGGTLRHDTPSYVERWADRELLHSLRGGEFCYVLTSRQTGKSSLMVRTAGKLREEGRTAVLLDLSALGQNATPEQWYSGLLVQLATRLGLGTETLADWRAQSDCAPVQRFFGAVRELVARPNETTSVVVDAGGALGGSDLPGRGHYVIFIDEIDAVRSLPFPTDELFAAIRECYNARAEDPRLERLTFCLLGVAAPTDLIRDTRMTPFNIGRRIELEDFTEQEAAPLATGFGTSPGPGPEVVPGQTRPGPDAQRLLKRVLYWTGGHPYLTQRLCQVVLEQLHEHDRGSSPGHSPTGLVDRLCAELFLSRGARERDDNLIFVRERLLRSELPYRSPVETVVAVLDRYGQVRRGKTVRDDDTDPVCELLKLSGIVASARGLLRVRNRIYARVFDRGWVARHLPDAEARRQQAAYRLGLVRATALCSVLVTAVSLLAGAALRGEGRAEWLTRELAAEKGHLSAKNVALQAALTSANQQRHRAEQEKQRADDSRAQAIARAGEARASAMAAAVSARRARISAGRALQAQRIAREHSRESQRGLVRLYVANGWRQVEEGDPFRALSWFAEALRTEPEGSRQQVHRERIAATLAQCPSLKQLWLPGGNPTAVAFSSDGREVAAGSDTGAGRIWDCMTGRAITPVLRHAHGVAGVTFSPNGRSVLTVAGEHVARLWPVGAGKPLALAHTAPVNTAVFSPDSRRVLTASDDGTARLWDAATGRATGLLSPGLPVARAVFSPDGERILTCTRGKDPRADWVGSAASVWEAATGRRLFVLLSGAESLVTSACFSPDGDRVAVGYANAVVDLFSAGTGRRVATLRGHTDAVFGLRFSHDGHQLLTYGHDGTARLWSTERGELIRIFASRGVFAAEFSPDDRWVALGNGAGWVEVCDAATGRAVLPLLHTEGWVFQLAFSPNGRYLTTACAGGGVRLWDLRLAGPEAQPLQPEVRARYACLSPDGTRVLTENDDGLARVVDAATGHLVVPPMASGKPPKTRLAAWGKRACFSRDGRLVLIGAGDGSVHIFDAHTGRAAAPPMHQPGPLYRAEFSPGNRRIITVAEWDHVARLWDVSRGRVIRTFPHGDAVMDAAFSPDGRRLVTASEDHTARIWDVETGRRIGAVLQHAAAVRFARFSPDGTRVLTNSFWYARVWDARTGRPITPPVDSTGDMVCAAFAPDGRTVVNAALGSAAQVWDARTGTVLASPLQHASNLKEAFFSPDGVRLVTAANDGTARVWDARSGEAITPPLRHPASVVHAEFAPGGRSVLTVCDDGSVRIWKLPIDQRSVGELEAVCQVLSGEVIDPVRGPAVVKWAKVWEIWPKIRRAE